MSVKRKIVVPGVEVSNKQVTIHEPIFIFDERAQKILNIPHESEPDEKSKLWPPLVTSLLNKDSLDIEIGLILKRFQKISENDKEKYMNFHCVLAFDGLGRDLSNVNVADQKLYKLMIYVSFDSLKGLEDKQPKEFEDVLSAIKSGLEFARQFVPKNIKIIFDRIKDGLKETPKASLHPLTIKLRDTDLDGVSIKQISTVQAVFVSQNPETSRGTETTVQPGVGNG